MSVQKSIVFWLWNDGMQNRSFEFEHVNVAARMIRRTASEALRILCVTDYGVKSTSDVEVFPMPTEAAALGAIRSPEGLRFPSCYRRLWTFSEAAKALGEYVLLLDIDLVAMKDLVPLFDTSKEFIGWRPYRDWGRQKRVGGGIYMLKTGSRTDVWTQFHGYRSIQEARGAGFRGSDQAWISYKLADTSYIYGRSAGIYSVRDFEGPGLRDVPPDARLVQFNGNRKPWDYAGSVSWVAEHWR